MNSESRSRGRLTFKGSKQQPQLPKNREISSESNFEADNYHTNVVPEEIDDQLHVLSGIGTVITSGTTISGNGTKFTEQLQIGDAIMIYHPDSKLEQVRLVTMVLSNSAASLSSPLSSNITIATSFCYVKSPENLGKGTKRVTYLPLTTQETKQHVSDACGTYGRIDQTVCRVKKPGAFGGYTIISVASSSSSSSSREHLLDNRCKVKSDRHCG